MRGDPPSAPGADPGARALAPGAALAAAGQVLGAVSGAVVAIAIARLLGPESLGAYTVAVTLLLTLVALGSLGVESGTVYYVGSRAWAPARAWLETQGAALVIGLAVAGIGISVRILAPQPFEGLSLALVVTVVAAVPFALSWLYASSVALATSRYEDYVLPSAVQALGVVVAVTSLAALFDVAGAVAGLALANVLAALVAAARRPRASGSSEGRDEGGLRHLRRAAAFGIKTYLANALQFLNYRLDIFILNAVGTQAAVGHYSVAVSVTSLGWLLPRALAAMVFPRVAALTAGVGDDAAATRELVETKSLRHIGLLVAVSTAGLAGVLLVLVRPLFGSDFEPAIALGLILLPGVALLGIASVLMASVVGRGLPRYSVYLALLSTPPTIGLYALLIPPFGATGAAAASSVSYALSFVLAVVFFRRATGRAVVADLIPRRDDLLDYLRLYESVGASITGRRGRSGVGGSR